MNVTVTKTIEDDLLFIFGFKAWGKSRFRDEKDISFILLPQASFFVASNFIAPIPSRTIRQMLVNFSGVEL